MNLTDSCVSYFTNHSYFYRYFSYIVIVVIMIHLAETCSGMAKEFRIIECNTKMVMKEK
jgi:hypothetical protein